jgi:glycosyltransferase involved in cell wall biosynthesis
MYLRKNPIDIFHTQYIAPFWFPRNIKLVLTIHDISFNLFPEHIKKTDLFFLKTLIPRSIRRADKIITVSASERKNIIDFYKISPEKVDFTHNGVDYGRFNRKYSEHEYGSIREKYSLPEKFLLYIGTLQPRKNIPVLIGAMKKMDAKLVIAGDRNARNFDKNIDVAIEKNSLRDKVIFTGWVDENDKPSLLQMASCFIFPSLYEGFGIPLVEAMAAGTPVVCSDIATFREVAGDAALFCNPQDSADFREKIKDILDDEQLKVDLINKGLRMAKEYSWERAAEKTLLIYEKTKK